jgi:hypothetical protein
MTTAVTVNADINSARLVEVDLVRVESGELIETREVSPGQAETFLSTSQTLVVVRESVRP